MRVGKSKSVSIVTDNNLRQLLEEVIFNLEEELYSQVINPEVIKRAKLDLQAIESRCYIERSEQ